MNITFGKLRELSSSVQKGDDEVIIDYFNSFKGDNIYDKFISIMKCWEQDVSYTLNLNLNDKPTRIPLSYIISEFKPIQNSEISFNIDEFKILLDIPKSFDILVQESLPIYSIIKYIEISDKSINLLNLSVQDKIFIIDNLPAKVYTGILHNIIGNETNVVRFENQLLDKLKFNFITNEPLTFLRGLFNNFGDDYFKDVIFSLSKRIDGYLLMESTPLEIEYYIEKYSEEMQNQNTGLQI